MHKIALNTLTAFHEAGHAVVGWLLGFTPLSIMFCDEGEARRGSAEFATRQSRAIEKAEAVVSDIFTMLDIVVTLAGTEAEIRLDAEASMRKYNAMLARGIIPNDHRAIKRLLSPQNGYTQADIDVLMPPLLFACRMLVEANWAKIEALAEALLKDGIVRRREMLRILGRRTTSTRAAIFMVVWMLVGARLASPTIPTAREAASAA